MPARLVGAPVALANLGDGAGHVGALKTAVMGVPANALLLQRYSGGALPSLDTLATEFEFGYSMSKADAKAAAQVLIDSAKYAGVVDGEGNVHLDGVEVTDEASGGDDANHDPQPSDGAKSERTAAAFEKQVPPLAPTHTIKSPPGPPAPIVLSTSSSPVALDVKLDMSKWAVEDVLRMLAALGYEDTSRESRA